MVEVQGAALEERHHVRARSLPPLPERHDLSDLGKSESDSLSGPHEHQALQHLQGVLSIAGGGAGWLVQQTELLVVPNGLDCHASSGCHLADPHVCNLTA